jgi:hypothetical protein
MKTVFISLFIFSAAVISAQDKIQLSIEVTYTNKYCGGAKPTDEVKAQYAKSYPFKNSVLRLENENAGAKSKPIFIKTNAEGVSKTQLAAGTYNVFVTAKNDKKLKLNLSTSCKKMMAKSYGQITVNKQNLQQIYKIAVQFACNPCEPAKP